MQLSVDHDDGVFLLATGPNLVVVRWTGAPTAAAARLFAAANRRMRHRFPEGRRW